MTDARDDRLDVVIVGAGPTGLTLAWRLLALGVSFRIVDRQPDRVHESRALAVQPRTLLSRPRASGGCCPGCLAPGP